MPMDGSLDVFVWLGCQSAGFDRSLSKARA